VVMVMWNRLPNLSATLFNCVCVLWVGYHTYQMKCCYLTVYQFRCQNNAPK
jgi:hypothetical protein